MNVQDDSMKKVRELLFGEQAKEFNNTLVELQTLTTNQNLEQIAKTENLEKKLTENLLNLKDCFELSTLKVEDDIAKNESFFKESTSILEKTIESNYLKSTQEFKSDLQELKDLIAKQHIETTETITSLNQALSAEITALKKNYIPKRLLSDMFMDFSGALADPHNDDVKSNENLVN